MFCDKKMISPLETARGNQLNFLIEYKNINSDLWTGTCIGVGFEWYFIFISI